MSWVLRRTLLLLRTPLIPNPAVSIQQRAAVKSISLYSYSTKDHFDSLVPVIKKDDIVSVPLDEEEILSLVDNEETDDLSVPKKKCDALSKVDLEDVSHIAPQLQPTFNLAAYANRSKTLQKLVDLGVSLARWEREEDVPSYILRLDFDTHMKPYIVFLHNVGVAADDLGRWLTLNPLIFKESIDDLQVRVNYLISKRFDKAQIARIVSRNPKWLCYSTVEIDDKLGFFQRTFHLDNREVRYLATKYPQVITHPKTQIQRRNFMVMEEMGFVKEEIKKLLLAKPKLWVAHDVSLMRRFDFVHNVMGLPHSQILDFPKILTSRDFRLKERHAFLKSLNRDQYDCKKPNYVSPDALIAGDDVEFCTNVAKTPVIDFNNFLKTF